MIQVEEIVKKAYEESTTQIDRIIMNNQSYRISNVQYDDDCYENGNIFGTAIARSLEFEIENVIDLENKEFEYQTGIYVENEIKWISLGNFITQEVNPNDTTNITKIVAMDYMLKSNVEYKSQLNYETGKVTMLDVMEEACNQADLELATKDFANKDFIVDSNQFTEGTLIRQVFQAIAQISGTFAKIRNDNNVHLVTPKRKKLLVKEVHVMTVEELNKLPVEKLSAYENNYYANNYSKLVLKRNTHPINLVSLGMSDVEGENITLRDEESIIKDGENSLVINDNPFAYTQEKREQLITAIFNAVKGFEYTSFEIEGQAKFYLETGDEIAVVDKEGNVCLSFLFRFNYKSPNGLESAMEAPSMTKATVDYQNVPSALEIAKRAEIKIDKQEGKITQLVEENTENSEKISQVELTADEIKQEVSKKVGDDEIISKINQSAEQIAIKANKINFNGAISANGNFKIDTSGNMSCNDAEFNGGKVALKGGTKENPTFEVKKDDFNQSFIVPGQLYNVSSNGAYQSYFSANGLGFSVLYNDGGAQTVLLEANTNPYLTLMNAGDFYTTNIRPGEITISNSRGTGTVMHGREEGHNYTCRWTNSQLQFWVDTTNVGTLSDKRLKTEIKDIDEDFIKAIKEIEMKQFKVDNRNGLITFGILAQDLIDIFEKYNKNPFDYEIVYKTQYKIDDETVYYGINYEQFLILKAKAQELEIKELQEKEKQKEEIVQDLLKRVQALEKGANDE